LPGTHANRLVMKRSAHFLRFTAVTDPAVLIDLSHFNADIILDGCQIFRIAALAGLIACGGRLQLQGLVRALGIVDRPPLVKSTLHLRAITPTTTSQHFSLHCSLAPFLVALV